MTVARSLAAAQTIPVRGDVEANLEGHIRLIHAAAEGHAQVLVFPELSLTGYELDLADDLAFRLPSAGSSAILSEQGEFLAQLRVTGAGVAIAIEDETGWRAKEVMLGGR